MLETIRLMTIERVREGERPSEVIEAYGLNRTTIYKWMKTAFRPGGGSGRCARPKRAGDRAA